MITLGKPVQEWDFYVVRVPILDEYGLAIAAVRIPEGLIENAKEDSTWIPANIPRTWPKMLPARLPGDAGMWRKLETINEREKRRGIEDWIEEYREKLERTNPEAAKRLRDEDAESDKKERFYALVCKIAHEKIARITKERKGARIRPEEYREIWLVADKEARIKQEKGGGK